MLALLAISTFNAQLWLAQGQGTAFTYAGQLEDNGSPASGTYNLAFTLFDTNSGGSAVAGPVTSKGVSVSNGLFTVLVDFGPGAFTGPQSWLQIGVETNGAGTFSTLTPRQRLTPTPYAIFATTAGNVSGLLSATQLNGTVSNRQLANSSISVLAGPGLSGGGTVALGGSITLTNTGAGGGGGLVSVTGNSDITATTVDGVVTLGDSATNANTAGAIVKRDGSGNFSAGTITLSGNLALPALGVTPDIIYAGTNLLLYGDGRGNFFSGPSAGNLTTLTTSGTENTANGALALFANTSGAYNTASGSRALGSNTIGSFNTASGALALFANTSGSDNTANGSSALDYNTSGSYNTAIGSQALQQNTIGSDNTANGYNALFLNTIGTQNTAIGESALSFNTNGAKNTAVGFQALFDNVSGSVNTAAGYQALFNNTVGFQNTAYGAYALMNSTNDNQLVAIGYQALQNDNAFANGHESSGNGANTAVGFQALQLDTTGSGNTGIGYQALNHNTNGWGNTAIGAYALMNSTNDSQLVAIGYQALQNDNAYNTGSGNGNNTAIGYQALQFNTIGAYNTAIGHDALHHNTNGIANTATGDNALLENTSGSYNAALGVVALYSNTSGGYNTAIGDFTLYSNTSGSNNTAIGADALYALVGGANNTADGENALEYLVAGDNNIALGSQAGVNLTSGSDNIHIGNQGESLDSGVIRIGTPGTQTATYLAGTVYATAFNTTSDRNAKEGFAPVNPRSVLAKVAALPISAWHFKTDAGTRHIGPMAQDFYSAFDVGTDNQHIATVDESGVALAAIQGLNQKLEAEANARDAEIQTLKRQNDSLVERLNKLEAAMKSHAEAR